MKSWSNCAEDRTSKWDGCYCTERVMVPSSPDVLLSFNSTSHEMCPRELFACTAGTSYLISS